MSTLFYPVSLYLLHFNNYYNKKIKKYNTITEYEQYFLGEVLTGVNFKYKDGIQTTQIVNWNYEEPDYIIVVDENNEILCRWFVMEFELISGNQYKATLRRDVLADFYDSVMNSTCFIEKGWVSQTNPLIYNNENMGFNQIKTAEISMKNTLNCPWLVAYLSRRNGEGNYNSFKGSFTAGFSGKPDYTVSDISEYKFYNFTNYGNGYTYAADSDITFNCKYEIKNIGGFCSLTLNKNGRDVKADSGIQGEIYPTAIFSRISGAKPMSQEALTNAINNIYSNYHQYDTTSNNLQLNNLTALGTEFGYNTLIKEVGKIIKVGSLYYSIDKIELIEESNGRGSELSQGLDINTTLKNSLMIPSGIEFPLNFTYHNYISYKKKKVQLVLRSSTALTHQYSYSFAYSQDVTSDAPYEIIAAPYKDIDLTVYDTTGQTTIHHDKSVALQWFQELATSKNANYCYDIQLVPYIPQKYERTDIDYLNPIYCWYGNETETVTLSAVAYKLTASSFSNSYNITIPKRDNIKISNSCDLYRIVSPNGVGEYEFSPSKNNGFTRFEVDCTLIPYNPYIKINPVFSGLYGSDFNDYRGLICSGDFSLPIITSEWKNYQLNNKYYQQIFDRGIEHQEFNNKYSRIGDIIGSITGSLGGAAAGGLALNSAPFVGAAVGGIASIAGGIVDIGINQKMREEQIDYQKDLFGYQLGTIKARANSLSRTTSFNINNKYFPYIEYYTCSDEEIEAFENKLKYNGMSVGVIGKLSDYWIDGSFIQGRLIEIENISTDNHLLTEIALELSGGVRIYE